MAYKQEDKDKKVNAICLQIEEGLSARQAILNQNIPFKTFYDWIEKDEDKRKQYARACEVRADKIADEILDIADDGTNDYMLVVKGDVTYNVEDREVTNRSKLRVETRKWLLAKLAPKKYGDKLDLTSGGDAINTHQPIINIITPKIEK